MAQPQRHTRDSLLAFLKARIQLYLRHGKYRHVVPAILGDSHREHGVEFETYEHPVVMTVEEQAKHVGHLDGGFSKNLFLKDKKNRLYLVSALTTTQVDMKALSARLGLGKGGVRMAPEETLQAVLQVPLGSVTPFALINESARSVSLVLDNGFQSKSRMFFHPLSNDASTAVTTENLEKFLKAIGREPSYVDLEAAVVVGKDQPPDLAFLVPKEAEGQEAAPVTKVGQEVPVASVAPSLSKVPAVTVTKHSTLAALKSKQNPAVAKGNEVARVDVSSVMTSILDTAVAAAVAEVNLLALEEQNREAVAEKIDASVRLRLAPDLESLLMMFKNTMYVEGFKSAIESQRLGGPSRH